MMRYQSLYLAGVALAFAASGASAQDVLHTDLPDVNGTYGAGTAVTTTGPSGRVTTVTGGTTDGDRLYLPAAPGQWQQSAVGAGASVGITDTYSSDGDGAAYFHIPQHAPGYDPSKADLEYALSAPVALSNLNSISYDWFVDGSSTITLKQAPAIRLEIYKDATWAGYLVYEPTYQSSPGNLPRDSWVTETMDLDNGVWWATKSTLGPSGDIIANMKDLQAWIDGNAGSTLSVVRVNFGVGSGWEGEAFAAVDHVAFDFTDGPSGDFNFKVSAVPEPASWAMMIGGLAFAGGAMRTRRRKFSFA